MQTKILVVRFGSLGDIILTSPTVLNLKLNYPGCRLVYLTKERFRSVVEMIDGVDEIATIPDHASGLQLYKTLLQLDDYGFDIIADLHGNFRSWLTRKIVTASHKSVYPKRRVERVRAVKATVQQTNYPHTIDLYNNTLKQLGCEVYCRRPLLKTERSKAGDRQTVVIAPGAAHANKQWSVERFAQAAEKLHATHNARIVWAVTSADVGGHYLDKKLPDDDFIELVDMPLSELASRIADASLTIANDSGIAHLSSAVGTPVVAVFGSTHPVLGFAPRGLYDRVVDVDESCRPCSLHGGKPCHREERFCFTRVTPQMVAEAAAEILDARAEESPALFIDRDGTIIKNKHYLADPDGVDLIPGAARAIKLARDAGYKIVIVTNQSGVARGLFSIDDVERTNARVLEVLAARGAEVDGLYYCPHHARKGRVPEFAVLCNCRKPAVGMAEEAALELGIDLRRSVMIGDSSADLGFGRTFGGRSLLVRTGYGVEVELKLLKLGDEPGEVFDDLLAAVRALALIS